VVFRSNFKRFFALTLHRSRYTSSTIYYNLAVLEFTVAIVRRKNLNEIYLLEDQQEMADSSQNSEELIIL